MFGFGRPKPPRAERRVLTETQRPDFIYAVGDVHGCLREMLTLEKAIAAHISGNGGSAQVVYLGDLIDRGPGSSAVIEHMLSRDAPFHRKALCGNHEEMFLDFLVAPAPRHSWLQYGGVETLASYGLDAHTLFDGGRKTAMQRLAHFVPDDHVRYLQSLPVCLAFPGLTLVHAGLEPGLPLDRQSTDEMMWRRLPVPAYTEQQPFGLLVHGHTPGQVPVVEQHRICIDTGCFATGILTAVCLDRDNRAQFLTAHIAANRNDNS